MRLQQKAVLFTLPFIMIPTLILGWLSVRYTQSAQEQIEYANMQTNVNYRSDALERYFESEKNSLVGLINTSEFRDATRSWRNTKQPSLIKEQLSQPLKVFFSNYPDVLAVKIFDNSLNEVITLWRHKPVENLKTDALLKSYADLHILKQDSVTDSLSLIQSPWFASKFDSQSMLHSLGFIQLISKPDWIDVLRLNEGDGNSFTNQHQVIISSKQGKILFAYPQQNLGRELPSQIFNKLKASAETHTAVEVNNNGLKMNFAGRLVEDRFLLLYGHEQTSVFAADTSYTWISILTVLLTIIISPILLYVNFTRLIIEPIERLTSAKRQVAQGNLDIKLDEEREDEIGELFASFNVMVKQLVVYRENEGESRLRLEYKVKERTEELESTNTALANSNKALATAKEQSEHANELKSAFVANISHEIRTPLTAILGFTEQVLSTELKNDHQKDLLNRVLKSGRHLLALINDILDLSKIESNKLDIELREIEFFELFQDLQSIVAPQATSKGLDFNVNLHYPIPQNIWTDSTRLKQILINLISNAIKFTEQGKVHVDVWFDESRKKLFVKVTDSGIGMSEDVQKRVFAPFVQADVSISRKFGGTGLGLVISKSLAHLLGGDIVLKSKLNEGSQFILDINVANHSGEMQTDFIEHEEQFKALTSQYQSSQSTQEKQISGRILVAEDVEDNQYLFSMLLDALSLDYVIVDNGQKAVESVLADDFDLILMDMQMPIMGGLEATKLIRQSGVDVPIYALTANVMREDVALHLEAGCDGTIAKPIDKAELITILKSHLSEQAHEAPPIINDDKMAELTRFYLGQLADQVKLLEMAQSTQDVDLLKSECHKIKGSAGSYGFGDLTDLAGQLEVVCKKSSANDSKPQDEPDWSEIQTLLTALIDKIHQTLEKSPE